MTCVFSHDCKKQVDISVILRIFAAEFCKLYNYR